VPLYALGDLRPRVHESAFIAPTAVLIGDVVVEANASIWFGAVLRGDSGQVVVGEGTNIQDNAVLHGTTRLGRDCTVAHLALVHGVEVEDNVLIGNGALVYDGCHIRAGAVIGAGAVLAPNTEVPPGALMLGVPARRARAVNTNLEEFVRAGAADYHQSRTRYLDELHRIDDAGSV
jgi:carbonic anhydrase/acetyltransferase-like protein (isoleucine patch superfamily)